MAKTKYDQVESAVDDGLLKIKAEQLIENSEVASKTKNVPKNLQSTRKKLEELSSKKKQERRLIAAAMQYDVERLFKRKTHLYTEIGTYHDEFTELVKHTDSMDEEKWKRLLEIKEKLDEIKKKADEEKNSQTDDTIVEQQRKKHINKRFNVSDKWLPLQ